MIKGRQHYCEEPDWSRFRRHTKKFIPHDSPAFARLVFDYSLFACFPDTERSQMLYKVTFETLDHIPACIKYKVSDSVRFIAAEASFCGLQLVPMTVNTEALLAMDYEHFLNLHPVRYDKVNEAISLGEIDMPIVYLCQEGFPKVMNGRHRVVALYKYGLSTIDILIPQNERDEISSHLCNSKY